MNFKTWRNEIVDFTAIFRFSFSLISSCFSSHVELFCMPVGFSEKFKTPFFNLILSFLFHFLEVCWLDIEGVLKWNF